jgi:glycosyltransferase involved in cell wall biosynthesis
MPARRARHNAMPINETRPLRVLYVIDKLHRAGAQSHLFGLVEALDGRRVEPAVCCLLTGGPLADALAASGVPVLVLGLQRLYGLRAGRAFRRLVSWIAERRIDVVHTYLVGANIFGTLAGRCARAPAVVTSRRDTGFSRNWRLGIVEEWLVNPFVDRVTAVCEAAAVAARREPWLGGKVVTILNGIETSRWHLDAGDRRAVRREMGIPDEAFVAGIVAHLSPVKGHADLIRATPSVVARRPDYRLVVIGDGILRAELESLARSLGVAGHVLFVGVRADVARVLSALDVSVLASHTEGLSNTLLESMAAGLAVVATAVGGNLEVVRDGETGILCPPGDASTLAATLLRLADDAALTRRLGEAARRHVEQNFTLHRMVTEYERLYRSLVPA